MNTLYFIMGCSASGKSTRVHHLIQFLDSRKEVFIPLMAKGKAIGRHYVDRKLSIIGKEVISSGIKRWQGVDVFTGTFGSNEVMFQWFYDHVNDGNSLIVEGAGTLMSHRARPEVIEKQVPLIPVVSVFYKFPSFAEYHARIMSRAGYSIAEDSPMWKRNASVDSFMNRIIEESKNTSDPSRWPVYLGRHDDDVKHFGRIVLGNLDDGFEQFPVELPKNVADEETLF